MSDVMLHAVLNMPLDMWSDSELDRIQRHARYVQASERIRKDEQTIQTLTALLQEGLDRSASSGLLLWREKVRQVLQSIAQD